ncbi:putative orotidine 5'-phosphate decarboxylase/orotate phosphoribosyltransferase [Brachyspira intermedia PWS/A]|uniref:Multifunctional fusion protein n=1 Tax=Brachyspira intermedia (strain ATCC 51140 / PWS/A) TaxID=1045858 RepID=G0EL78_BRAIP|nr:orotidine-5'-phosphate decarboxylase [Brachyspira intermedia]AEM21456.1 putative orotidine 5'-phosphate decarboxylase/orotate phosphoribosyltransferase [Brachyspira intermedia PWS/A]
MTKLTENPKERLIIALDFNSMGEATKLIDELGDEAVFYKVGLELFLYTKGEIIEYLASKNKKVFLDLKFHDIPNTTAMASLFAAKQNVFMFNVHTSGGKKMMEKTVQEIKKLNKDNLIIGVTILTSLSENDVKNMFSSNLPLTDLAVNWAKLGKESGLDGVVCSPKEAAVIKRECGENFRTICPGVRPKWAGTDDQERVMTPKEAIENGCDYLVVGRPITRNEDRVKACKMIVEEISEGMENNKKAKSKLIAGALLETKAVKLNVKEPFTFVSGIKSPIYCDNRYVIGFPEARKVIVDAFVSILRDKDFDVIAGTATAGIPWASFIAYELNKPLCYIRAEKKEHGRGKQIEGAECNGKKLILIEDLISTGGSSIKAFEAAKAEGAIGLEIISIFTYEFEKAYKNFEEAGIKFSSLSNFSSLMEIAKDEKYITEEELSKALEWNKNPDAWGK